MDKTINIVSAVLACLVTQALIQTVLATEPNPESITLTFDTGAVSESELSGQRGREGLDVLAIIGNTNDLDATLTDNVANSTISGDNFINGGAFSGASGHSTAIQNTGNNNIIQDATIYNFTILP